MSAPNLPSEPDVAAEPAEVIVRRLVRAIDYAEGFWLGFVRCNLIDQRRKAAAACRDLLAPLGIRLVEIDLTEPVSELLPILKARIVEEQSTMSAAGEQPPTVFAALPAKLALFVYGLEHSIPSSEAYPSILSHLNLNRELFRQEILYPLVIWLPEYALTALARRAPDFWAWRSGFYELAPDAELAARTFGPIRDEALYVSASLSEQTKRERLTLLKGLFADYRELGDGSHERRAQCEILNELGSVHMVLGELSEAKQAYQESLAIARYDNDLDLIAVLVHNLAMLAQDQGDYEEARRLYNESLEIKKRLDDQNGIAVTLHELGRLTQRQDDYEEARRLYSESLEIKKRLGNQSGIAKSLHQLAMLARNQGDYEEARRLYSESLEIKKRLDDQSGIAISLHQLAMLAQDKGDNEEARRLYNESLEIEQRLGNQSGIAISLHQLAMLALRQGDYEEARRLYSESLEIEQRLGNQSGIAATLHELGRLARYENDYEESKRLYNESLAMKRKLGNISGEASSLYGLALLYEEEGKYGEAIEYAKQAQEIIERLKRPNIVFINEMLQRLQQKISAL
ncbi:MAG TPA: tetratricopeptide repeat protein [Blastocatellia bacterium]|nr:tetratricopeptide repeat protein [Blastocatellia bacterium]